MKNKLFKKKILHRSKYRGIKELDIIFERFISKYENTFTTNDLIELEQILNLPDSELLNIILKKQNIPSNLKGTILQQLLNFCDANN
tara:strand:- start:962 stop:1222 length:261 start_codon:yes stop_codon:yes gene_type:complete